jgi:hypothetical protein
MFNAMIGEHRLNGRKATITTHITGAYGCPRPTRQRWITRVGSAFGASTEKYDEGNQGLCKP